MGAVELWIHGAVGLWIQGSRKWGLLSYGNRLAENGGFEVMEIW